MAYFRDNTQKPHTAESMLAIKMLILAVSIWAGDVNAKLATKMAMVKPMPPSMPAPNICLKLVLVGKLASLYFTEIQDAKKMPMGLPSKSPVIMPRAGACHNPSIALLSITMAVFAKANTGKTNHDTGSCNLSINCAEGDCPFISLNGMANASKTPAMVA